jgi:hypothetical protein
MAETTDATMAQQPERALAYRILRYVPNLVRGEWVNIGVLVFNPESGERRLRLIEKEDEYNRVRRLHPWADESLLRALRDELENRLDSGGRANGGVGPGIPWQKVLSDLDHEVERLYADDVAVPRRSARPGLPGGRAGIRAYCAQVFRQARLWDRIEKSVRVAEFTFPEDPGRLDYSYRRNGTRGFVHIAKSLAYNVKHIADKARYHTEFAAVTDVRRARENDRHRFVLDTLGEAGIEPVPTEGLAVWVAKLRPSLLQ